MDALAVDEYVRRFGTQVQTVTNGACCATFEARQHHFVLDAVVLLTFQFMEEDVETSEIFVARPDQMFLFRRQGIERRVNREVEFAGVEDQFVIPCLQLRTLPARNRSFVDCFGFVGYDEVFVDTHDDAETATFGACTDRAVEVKEVFGGFNELNAIRFEAFGEHFLFLVHPNTAFALPFEESCLYAVCKAVAGGLFMVYDDTINEQEGFVTFDLLSCVGIQADRISVDEKPAESLTLPEGELFLERASFGEDDRAEQVKACAYRLLFHVTHNVPNGVLAYFYSTHGRVCLAYARVQKFEVVVYLCDRTDRGAGISAAHFLLDSDSRRDAFYLVHFGFLHAPHELAGVRAEALDVASLPFSIERVERQRTFSAAAYACDHHQFIARYIYRHMFEIVGVSSYYANYFLQASSASFLILRKRTSVVSRWAALSLGTRIGVPMAILPGFVILSLLAS